MQLDEYDEKEDKTEKFGDRKKVTQSVAAPKKSMLNFKQEAIKKMSQTDSEVERQPKLHEEFGFSLRGKASLRKSKSDLNTPQRI